MDPIQSHRPHHFEQRLVLAVMPGAGITVTCRSSLSVRRSLPDSSGRA
ncbi:MAG: hypothetical protein ACI9OJ_000298 [Myxococcota bacterium]|jgi:hypothetical protein